MFTVRLATTQWLQQVSKCTELSIALPIIKSKVSLHLSSQSLDRAGRHAGIPSLYRPE